MNIVKEINGCIIEKREHNGNEYFVVWCGDEYNILSTLNDAIIFALKS